ncbi:pantetheine-phosphate adenylyltransferase [Thermosipho atlanticus]|uniref:Phosphopantetheine adenylyltransferase n=1 Tax=Thermosipho atlanticus DSM 15807 TaxID=1123380 RepID=A0A1M5T3E7_9BACT|nr:pantetheine-phosphate adenylyltransferase [Thermosipho atlanticus]SHH44893.1 Phosphopantetheine adenylyltransferase [Thermosipho atlanticus DSM 15807]
MKAIYPGSFDPITFGHLDIIERASKIFSEVYVVVMENKRKNYTFSLDERIKMIEECTEHIKNIKIDFFKGLLIDYVKENKIDVVIRGLRAVTDFEYELQMAMANKEMCPDADTIFLMTDKRFSFISSSLVKEVAYFGGDISRWVPKNVERKLIEKIKITNI